MEGTQLESPRLVPLKASVGTTSVGVASFVRLVIVAAVGLVVSACLGPTEYDPTGNEPIGTLDMVEASGTAVRVAGWAIDPNTTAPIDVEVIALARSRVVRADRVRHDVAAVHRAYGANHGFDFTTESLGAGRVTVCVGVRNVGPGSRGRSLGCRDVTLRSDDSQGIFDSARAVSPSVVRVSGWALDYEAPRKSIDVEWSLNSGAWNRAGTPVLRGDVNTAMSTTGNHGFDFDVAVSPGTNTVCVRVPAYGRGKGKDLGCRTATYQSVSPVAPGMDLLEVFRVGPRSGHPLAAMSRDAGVSTILGDGSVMWFFGDTSEFDDSGRLKYFVNNTAAWATGALPHMTRDAVGTGTMPILGVAPLVDAAPFDTPCAPGWSPGLWPLAAVTVAQSPGAGPKDPGPGVLDNVGASDNVFVYFANMCLGTAPMEMESRGVGLATFTYNAAAPPDEQPLQGQIVRQNLFDASFAYGTAAITDGEFIYAYRCSTPTGQGTVRLPDDPAYGPCTVARVAPANAGDPTKYSYYSSDREPDGVEWNEESNWVLDPTAATAMTIPSADPAADREMPVASFTVVDDPHHGYLMVYSPWPGFTDEVIIRRGRTPVGPWSSAERYRMPGCSDFDGTSARFCYAATAQPAFSTATTVGVGYYDQLTELNPLRGSYLAGRVASRWGVQIR